MGLPQVFQCSYLKEDTEPSMRMVHLMRQRTVTSQLAIRCKQNQNKSQKQYKHIAAVTSRLIERHMDAPS